MPTHLKFCGCRRCRSGMRSRWGSVHVQKIVRKVRRNARQRLKQGQEPDPKASVGYTD